MSRKLAKVHKLVVIFFKFFFLQEIGHGEVKFRVEFYTYAILLLWPFLRMRTKSAENGSKPGQNSGYV